MTRVISAYLSEKDPHLNSAISLFIQASAELVRSFQTKSSNPAPIISRFSLALSNVLNHPSASPSLRSSFFPAALQPTSLVDLAKQELQSDRSYASKKSLSP